jgi:hypothetical protein
MGEIYVIKHILYNALKISYDVGCGKVVVGCENLACRVRVEHFYLQNIYYVSNFAA